MAPNCKIPSSLLVSCEANANLPDHPMLLFEMKPLQTVLPRKLFDERIVPFTCKRAVGV
jgi:hypothetical protein